jgi:DNA invertase Pin-like site-specific DNA recombinase
MDLVRPHDTVREEVVVGKVYGYIRASVWKKALSAEDQAARIVHYIRQRKHWSIKPAEALFYDPAPCHGIALRDRVAGGALMDRVRRGDVVVATSLDRLVLKAVDCAALLDLWDGLGVALHLTDYGGEIPELGNRAFAKILARLEQIRGWERSAYRGAKGAYGHQPPNGWPPHGQVWVCDPDTRTWRLERDDAERALMGELLGMYEAGLSVAAIVQRLGDEGRTFEKTVQGRPVLLHWSVDGVWGRIQAEIKLRQQEQGPSEPAQPR